MTAQASLLEAGQAGVYLALMLFLVMILTVLGVVAHAAFA
jgi:hypothetical protein